MRTLSLRVALVCALFGAPTAQGQNPEQAPAAMTIAMTHDSIAVSGSVSSAAHEDILRQLIADRFAGRTPTIDLTPAKSLPPGWALATEMTLRAVASTRSATVSIASGEISIKGITTDAPALRDSLARVEQSLLPGMTLTHDVAEISPNGSMNRQCIELFRTAMRGRRIGFAHGSAEIGTAAAPMLDELVQILADCPSSSIAVKGHTDSTGDEASNLKLSQDRADAVAAYIVDSGIAKARIESRGVGSAEPVANEVDARARELNRRIEIDIRFP